MMGEVEINDCWSLTEVVRECARKARLRAQLAADTNRTTTTTTNISPPTPMEGNNYSYSQKQNFDQFVLENNSAGFMLPSAAGAAPAVDGCTSRDELIDEMYKPFLSPHNLNNSMVEATNHLVPPNPQQIRNLNRRQGSSAIGHHLIEKRNRKYEDRRVVKCLLEELSKNEKWAWRKYGQKPIKGSPYPRNYYRCSTMKGCKARKQVERSPVDPNSFIVTYTSYHLHPYPHLRNYHGPRAKPKGSDPDPTPESESPIDTEPGQNGSGSGSGPGCDVVKFDEELDDNDDGGGGGDESFGSGGKMDEGNNNEDEIFMTPNATADSDLLTGMEQLCGKEKTSASRSNSNSNSNDYNKNVGFDINCGSESRMNNEEVQIKDNK